MAIRGKRLYTMGHEPTDQPASAVAPELLPVANRGTDVVHCLDVDSGKTIWTHRYPCLLVDRLHEGGPAATPTLDDNHCYTVSKEGHLFCLAADTGKVIWQRRFSDDLGVPMPQWGFACSPLVWKNLVIVDGGRIAAYDKHNGQLVWKTRPFQPGYGSAISWQVGDRTLIAVLNNEALVLVQADTGKEIAEFAWETDYLTTAATPLVADNRIFISSGYNCGCALLQLDGDKLNIVYENRNMRNHFNSSVLWQGHLYGFDGNSHSRRTVTLNCMNFDTGELLWEERGLGCGSLMLAGGILVVLSDRGELVTAPANPEQFTELARAPILNGRCWTVPVLAGGRLFARNAQGDLVCVDLRPTTTAP